MDSVVRKAVFYNFMVFGLVFLSTPGLHSLRLSGNIDALCAGLLVAGICQLLLVAGRHVGVLLAATTVCLVVVFNIGSKFYLDQQQFYISVQTLYLVTEILSLLESQPFWKLSISAVCLMIGMALTIYLVKSAKVENKFYSFGTGSVLVGIVFGLQVVYADITREDIFDSSEATPIGYLIRSSGVLPFVKLDREWVFAQERKLVVTRMLENQSLPFPDKYSVDSIYALLGREPSFPLEAVDPKFPIYRQAPDIRNSDGIAEAQEKYNVLVLVLESVRASEMGVYGAENSATPFLDSLASENIFASKFYATSNFTVKSEHAINCSAYDYMIGAPVSKRGTSVRTQCLPDLLKKSDYQTFWFHGNDTEFYNRGQYLPKLGFQQVYSKDELNADSQLPILGWGISDPALFDQALEKLESIEGPFYSEILSVSNHMPFDFDWGIEFPDHLSADSTMFERYRRGIYYTDYAVKSFYSRFEKSALAKNTILVITGDHGIWTFSDDQKSGLQKNEEFFRVPLVMVTPDRRQAMVDGTHSHLDIAPTLLDVMGIEENNAFIGESIFSKNPNKSSRALYLMTEQALSYRFKNKACIPSIQCQGNINCNNSYEIEPATTQCFAVEEDEDLLLSAEGLISDGSTVTLAERVLFDYTQMALELGTSPQFSPAAIMSATIEE